MQFDRSMRGRWTEADEGWQITLPEGWGQGRTVFGGMTAAVAASLASRLLGDGWVIRTVNVQFMRPTAPGVVRGRFQINRAGKGTTFAEVRLSQGGETTLVAQLVCVRPRARGVRVEAPPFRGGPPVDDLPDLPYLPGVTPEFTQHVKLRWADGTYPFSDGDEASITGYCRMKAPCGDVEGILGLLDVWPCPSLSVLAQPTAASTVMWTAHLIDVPPASEAWFGYEYDTEVGRHGLHTAVGRLFSPDGRLVAWSEQLVMVFG